MGDPTHDTYLTSVLFQSAIQRIIPHRYPFLLVDRVIELVPEARIVATKRFSVNDEAPQGHFPETPMVPGGVLIEALTQLGAILVLAQPEMTGKLAVILNVPAARMLQPVRPGDTLRLEVEVVRLHAGFGELRGVVYRDGALLAEGQMRFAIANAAELLPGQTAGPR